MTLILNRKTRTPVKAKDPELVGRIVSMMRSKTSNACGQVRVRVDEPEPGVRVKIHLQPQREPVRLPEWDGARRFNGRRHSRRNNGQKPQYKNVRRSAVQ
jgi:hypothetical protein